MDMTGPTPVNVAREMQQKITEARQTGNLDALIAIENELGQIADETDKMIAGVMRGGAQYVPPAVDAPPAAPIIEGELLPQVDESDAVQTLPETITDEEAQRSVDAALNDAL